MNTYGSFAYHYDRFIGDIDYKCRANYFDKLIKGHTKVSTHSKRNKGILLDLACGTGSLSVEMAKLGYDVVGVDGSEEMLGVAMGKEGLEEVLLLHQNMTDLDLYGTVDAVVCALDSINHLADIKEVGKVFERVALFLEQGGVFIFDVNSAYKHRHVLADNTFVYEQDEDILVWRNYTNRNLITDIEIDIFAKENGNYIRVTERFTERAYPVKNLVNLLKKSGFEDIKIYAADTQKPPTIKCERLVFLAVKA